MSPSKQKKVTQTKRAKRAVRKSGIPSRKKIKAPRKRLNATGVK